MYLNISCLTKMQLIEAAVFIISWRSVSLPQLAHSHSLGLSRINAVVVEDVSVTGTCQQFTNILYIYKDSFSEHGIYTY